MPPFAASATRSSGPPVPTCSRWPKGRPPATCHGSRNTARMLSKSSWTAGPLRRVPQRQLVPHGCRREHGHPTGQAQNMTRSCQWFMATYGNALRCLRCCRRKDDAALAVEFGPAITIAGLTLFVSAFFAWRQTDLSVLTCRFKGCPVQVPLPGQGSAWVRVRSCLAAGAGGRHR
jgi:hypothetical protein